ncbi:restriction endonuclease subunit S [Photobacterium damselae]
MSKYQAYPEYKDSEVEWLGNLPNSWYESSLKYLLSSVIAGGTPDSSNEIYWTESGNGTPWVSIADITKNTLITSTNKDVTNLGMLAKNLKLLPKGTILYSIFASLGKIAVANKPLVTNQAILGLTPNKKVNKNFLCFWLSQLESHLSLFSTSNTQDNLNAEKVGNLPVFVPSLNEQTQIAAFLDHETAKIDTLIEKQQQLIELLKEKRQAVISHAVTKGLNPDAPMKNSGVEWLGEVPEHWEGSLFKYLVNQMGGGTPDKSNTSFWNGDIPWVSPKDMKVDYISSSQDFITETAIKESSTKLIPEHSILMVVRGMILIHSVPVALTIKPVTINQDMKALIPSAKILPEFLLFFLKGLKDYILDFVETSAHGTKCLRTEDFENMLLFIPPKDEQAAILSSIKTAITQLDSLIKKANNAISLMQERRTALISAAVTGKIDVRNWVAPATSSDTHEAQQEVTA